ncbi:MAG TPA: RsmB/NOP family class I SAM-dependent RNA methyltransferase [Rhizomicrobium sp.]|nr:RsmB/NOP family class I SAM-dependent RNA methyltransferase [Rhizomicrobium sp.]
MTPGARLQAAIDILGELDRTDRPVERHLRDWGRAHRFAGSKDRAAIAERVYVALRHRSSFAWRMGSESPRALVIASLLVEGADPASLFTGGYAPAPLCDAERAAIAATPAPPPPHAIGEYPPFLEGELKRAFGDALIDETLALQDRAPVDLRVNTLKSERNALVAALRSQGYEAEPAALSPTGIRIPPGARDLERTAEFESGAFEFQDEAAQLCALLCGVKPGMRVLDFAAGAGGKALALAAIMNDEGEIVARDVRNVALAELQRRAIRAGVMIIHSFPLPHAGGGKGQGEGVSKVERAAAAPSPRPSPPLRGGEGGSLFDVVLLDAPCSGTGTWRRQPELRWRLTPERLGELKLAQDALLMEAAKQVRPGGRLVYATCSVLPCENEDRIAAFLETHRDFALAPAEQVWRESMPAVPPPKPGRFFRASPFSTGTDGFFTAILARNA